MRTMGLCSVWARRLHYWAFLGELLQGVGVLSMMGFGARSFVGSFLNCLSFVIGWTCMCLCWKHAHHCTLYIQHYYIASYLSTHVLVFLPSVFTCTFPCSPTHRSLSLLLSWLLFYSAYRYIILIPIASSLILSIFVLHLDVLCSNHDLFSCSISGGPSSFVLSMCAPRQQGKIVLKLCIHTEHR